MQNGHVLIEFQIQRTGILDKQLFFFWWKGEGNRVQLFYWIIFPSFFNMNNVKFDLVCIYNRKPMQYLRIWTWHVSMQKRVNCCACVPSNMEVSSCDLMKFGGGDFNFFYGKSQERLVEIAIQRLGNGYRCQSGRWRNLWFNLKLSSPYTLYFEKYKCFVV